MDIFIALIFGVIGLALGFNIPGLSFRIMEYKKGKGNVEKSNIFLYSLWSKLVLCIFNAAVWVLAALNVESSFIAFLVCMQISIGLIIVFIDINIRIIPNELVLTLVIMGIIFQLVNYGFKSFLIAVVCMFVMMSVFTSVAAFVGFGKVGAGDVKLAGVIGLSLGYPLIITAVGVMAFVLLSFIVIGLATKKIYLSTMLPLAPFLVSGYVLSLIALVFNLNIIY